MGLEAKTGLFWWSAAGIFAAAGSAPAGERLELAAPQKISLKVEKKPLSEMLQLLQEKLGRPVVYLPGKPVEDQRVLATEVSLALEGVTVWEAVEQLAAQSEVRLQGVGGRCLLLERADRAQPSRSVRFRPTVSGPFQLAPVVMDPQPDQVLLRLRPEPWIGKPRLNRYKVTWTFHNQKTFVYDPKRIDTFSILEDELLIPLAQPGTQRLAAARAVEIEAQLILPCGWEAQTLPAVGKLKGKKLPVGKVEVAVKEARWKDNSYFVTVQVEGHAIPSAALTLLNGQGERVTPDERGTSHRNGWIEVRLEFARLKLRGDPATFPLVLEAPTREEPHMLRTRVEVSPLPKAGS